VLNRREKLLRQARRQPEIVVDQLLAVEGSYSRCMHLRNMMAKSAALGQGVLAKK
jgi:hypothetical protein